MPFFVDQRVHLYNNSKLKALLDLVTFPDGMVEYRFLPLGVMGLGQDYGPHSRPLNCLPPTPLHLHSMWSAS